MAKGMVQSGSLLKDIPETLWEESFHTLCSNRKVKIERIVSKGHASPEGFWYDQEENEFVVIFQGRAGLQVEDQDDLIVLSAGDYVNIGAHVRHRIEWTDPSCETIWLAVHY